MLLRRPTLTALALTAALARHRAAFVAVLALGAIPGLTLGCTTLATSPSWVGGGLEVTAPIRAAQEDARIEAERARVAAQPKEIGAKHILVMHAESKSKPEGITRSRDDARKRAEEVLAKIAGGADWNAMVNAYTDEPGGVERNGDLGLFDRTTMVRGFADVAFTLRVGEVSPVVETVYGFHIIQRTE